LARDVRGIGFRAADQIAAKLGSEKTALIRVRAGISIALAEAMDEGHCGLPEAELVPLAQRLLEVPAELITTALAPEIQDGTVIADDLDGRRCVFLAGPHKLKTLMAADPPWRLIDADKAIPWVEKRTKLALAESQKGAIRVALCSKVLVITGGPGVGKTTLVNSLLKILLAKTVGIALCAPPVVRRNVCPKAPVLKPRPSTACRRPTREPGLFGAMRRTASTAICSLSTRHQWSTCR